MVEKLAVVISDITTRVFALPSFEKFQQKLLDDGFEATPYEIIRDLVKL